MTTAVEFYWRPGCLFCTMLRARLRPTGLPVREVNIWADPDAAARVRAVADGNETVPTVFVSDRALVNPGVKEVLAAVREHAPELLPTERQRPGWWPWTRS
ncbi:MAG: glutaredoxin domain-containing protein [Pseudonocardiaceae bacterium]